MRSLTTLTQFEELLAEGSDWILFKHSPTCPVSITAYKQVEKAEQEVTTDIYLLNVLSSDDLKYAVEKRFGITHESPQVIVIKNGQPIADASHLAVSARWIVEQVA